MEKHTVLIKPEGSASDALCVVKLLAELPTWESPSGFRGEISSDTMHWLARQSENDKLHLGKLLRVGMLAVHESMRG